MANNNNNNTNNHNDDDQITGVHTNNNSIVVDPAERLDQRFETTGSSVVDFLLGIEITPTVETTPAVETAPAVETVETTPAVETTGSSVIDFLLGIETTPTVVQRVYTPEELENVGGGGQRWGIAQWARDRVDHLYIAHIRPWAQYIDRRIRQWREVRRAEGTLRERVENLV